MDEKALVTVKVKYDYSELPLALALSLGDPERSLNDNKRALKDLFAAVMSELEEKGYV